MSTALAAGETIETAGEDGCQADFGGGRLVREATSVHLKARGRKLIHCIEGGKERGQGGR
jgi:hypothetical protein